MVDVSSVATVRVRGSLHSSTKAGMGVALLPLSTVSCPGTVPAAAVVTPLCCSVKMCALMSACVVASGVSTPVSPGPSTIGTA